MSDRPASKPNDSQIPSRYPSINRNNNARPKHNTAKVLENSFVLEENKDLHDFVEENQKVCRFDKENEIKANKSLSKSSDFEELNTKNKSISNSSDFEELHAKNKSISKQYSINKDFNEKNSYLSQNNDLKQDFESKCNSHHYLSKAHLIV